MTRVWETFFRTPGMYILEEYSVPDAPNRWLTSWDEIAAQIGDPTCSLAAWFEPAGGKPREKKITFTPETQRKLQAHGRSVLETPALITIRTLDPLNGCLGATAISYWTEKGARQRSMFSEDLIDQVDWRQLHTVVARLERRIKSEAPAKLRASPVMSDAFDGFRKGEIKLWYGGQTVTSPSPLVVQRELGNHNLTSPLAAATQP